MKVRRKLDQQISPHFHRYFKSKKVHQIDEGGRGSTKTSKNGLKVAYHMVNDPNCNVVIIRRHKNTLRDSMFAELKKAFKRIGLREGIHYTSTTSPMKITLLINGNTAYFGGLDDYEKLKGMVGDDSNKDLSPELLAQAFNVDEDGYLIDDVDDDAIKIVWIGEITEIKNEDDILQTVATFSRGKKAYFMVLYEYNPPKNKFHWVNQWKDTMSKRPDVRVQHSDYRTVPKEWLGPVFLQQAEQLKNIDPDRYDHIYLGMVTGLDGLIYNTEPIKIIDELPPGEEVIYTDIYIDAGHMSSATVYLCVGVTNKGNFVWLDTYYYSPNGKSVKKAPSELSKDLWDFIVAMTDAYDANYDTVIIDSAEGGLRNQFMKDYGIRLRPVAKKEKEDMIDYSQDLFSTGKFYIINNANNQQPIREHQRYEWEEGSVEKGRPKPNKIDQPMNEEYYNSWSDSTCRTYGDHTCDALQYGATMNLRKYGLKI